MTAEPPARPKDRQPDFAPDSSKPERAFDHAAPACCQPDLAPDSPKPAAIRQDPPHSSELAPVRQDPAPRSPDLASIRDDLAALADPAYQQFQAKLVPNIDAARVLGVRTPALRAYARAFARDPRARSFMDALPHETYEENNLHAELIGRLAKTPEDAFRMLDAFLPYVDNWATCDLMRIPAFKKDLAATYRRIVGWTAPDQPEYAVRFGVVTLMELFLGEAFSPEHLQLVARIDRPEYYINMARAWYYSMALVKRYEETVPLFEARPIVLDAWTHNKSLQKARESRVPSAERKAYLQSLKVKAPRTKR